LWFGLKLLLRGSVLSRAGGFGGFQLSKLRSYKHSSNESESRTSEGAKETVRGSKNRRQEGKMFEDGGEQEEADLETCDEKGDGQ